MAAKKYLYKKDGTSCAALIAEANRYMPLAAQISAAKQAFPLHCCQVSVDEGGKEDLDEIMTGNGYEYHGEITVNDAVASGEASAIPLASEVPDGFQFLATDTRKMYYNVSNTWYYVELIGGAGPG